MKIRWTDIREQYMYGYRATNGDRMVEVLRCEVGRWHAFFYLDGKLVVTGYHHDVPFDAAMHQGRTFLHTGCTE